MPSYLICNELAQRRAVALCGAMCCDKARAHTEAWRSAKRKKCAVYQDYLRRIGVLGIITQYVGQTEPALRGNLRRVRLLGIQRNAGAPKEVLWSTVEALEMGGGVRPGDRALVTSVGLDGTALSDAVYYLPIADLTLFSYLRSKES